MAWAGLDKEIVIWKAAELANEIGFEKITLKLLAEKLNVQLPSLYNYIKGIDDLQREILLFGWKQVEAEMLGAAVCVSGYEALEAGKSKHERSLERHIWELRWWYADYFYRRSPGEEPDYESVCKGVSEKATDQVHYWSQRSDRKIVSLWWVVYG